MKRRSKFRFGDLLAATNKNAASSSSRPAATDEADLQRQLADAQKEAQDAMAEWRRYPVSHYELAWAEAVDKVKRLEARLLKRKAASR